MDSDTISPQREVSESRAEFRKPATDAANRKYRRRSPVSGSSSSDGSPRRQRGLSPVYSRGDEKVSKYQDKKDDRGGNSRGSSRSQHVRGGDSSRYSSRSSQGYSRYDDHARHGKYADEDDRSSSRVSSRSRETRGNSFDYNRSRDRHRDADKYTKDKSEVVGHANLDKDRHSPPEDYRKYRHKDSSSDKIEASRRRGRQSTEESKYDDRDRNVEFRDEKRDYRSSRDYRNDRVNSREESWGHQSDTTSRRDRSGRSSREAYKDDLKEMDNRDEKRRRDEQDVNRPRDKRDRVGERFEQRSAFANESDGCVAKRSKSSPDKDSDKREEVQGFDSEATTEQPLLHGSESAPDVDAAKVAAMKAAELVNKNLVGTGFMTAEQKKKLLWGNKKNNTSEEPSRRWDATLFPDRERQEKFNKLMGVKGDVKVEQGPNSQDGDNVLRAEKQKELQMDLEKQYTAGLRRRDGRTVGLGL